MKMTNKLFYLIMFNAFFILTQAWADSPAVTFEDYFKKKEERINRQEAFDKTMTAEAKAANQKAKTALKVLLDKALGQEQFREKVQSKAIYAKLPEFMEGPGERPTTGVEYRFEKLPPIFVTDTRFEEALIIESHGMPHEGYFLDPALGFLTRHQEIKKLKFPGFDRVWASMGTFSKSMDPSCGETLVIIARRGTRIYTSTSEVNATARKPLMQCKKEFHDSHRDYGLKINALSKCCAAQTTKGSATREALENQINSVLSLIQ
jgi:hypothetical protein